MATESQAGGKPPSSDGPHVKRARPRKRGQRKRGGQRGHPKQERRLLPSDECLEVIPVKPTTCQGCGEALKGSDHRDWRNDIEGLGQLLSNHLPAYRNLITSYNAPK